jgi:hypothetical protein
MNFNKYVDSWTFLKRNNLHLNFESRENLWNIQREMAEMVESPFLYRRVELEKFWIRKGRPYYNIYPAVMPMVESIKLDIPCDALNRISIEPLEVRLPEQGNESLSWIDQPSGQGYGVKTILFGIQKMPREPGLCNDEDLIDGLCICFDIGELSEVNEPVYSFKFFPLRADRTVEECVNLFTKHKSADYGVEVPEQITTQVIKLCACIALIDEDSEVISPDILVADKDKWASASPQDKLTMIAKAQRRGKFGWNMGAQIQCSPHYRRPHLALVRVGKGRTLTKIIMRSGSIVHRDKLASVPTGFGDETQSG